MARTDDEIRASLIESLRAIDRSIDTVKGPVFDFLLQPVPTELQRTEADVERLQIMTTLQLGQVITSDEAAAMATAFSILLGGGRASKTRSQVFYTFTRPTQDIVIDRGVLVGTEDQAFTFFVSAPATLPVATVDNFFNPLTRRYEILLKCEATAVGPEFDIAETRVSRLITPVDGIDGTTNIAAYTGGQLEPSLTQDIDRIRAKFAGSDPESGGGIRSDIRNYDPENVRDVSLVYPKNRDLFKRSTNRPAIDAYVLGDDVDTFTETTIAAGGETQIPIDARPVRSVTSVTVNGVGVAFSFVRDTTRETGFSPRSTDYVLLAGSLTAADVVVVAGTYNVLLFDMQSALFALDRPFDTDVLAREPREVGVAISLNATVVSSADPARVFTAIEAALFAAVEPTRFVDILQPEVIRQGIRDEVGGIADLIFTRFRRSSGGVLEVDSIDLALNEHSFVDQEVLDIRVRR